MALSKNFKTFDLDEIPAEFLSKKIKISLNDFRKEFQNEKIKIKEEPKDQQKDENFEKKIKKDPESDFLALKFKETKIPKPIKREVMRKEIKGIIKTKFSEFQCKICERYLRTKNLLKKHIELHYQSISSKSFTCDHCGKEFNEKGKIWQHMKAHSIYKIECEICKAQVRVNSLSTHIKFQHSKKEEIFQCEICNKILKNSKSLKNHLKTHEEKLCKCQFCDQKFTFQGHLNAHMKFHKNPERYKCRFCGKQTKSKRNLKLHLRTHEEKVQPKMGEKKFFCDHCGKGFENKHTICQHVKNHAVFKVECKICKAQVKMKSLHSHMKFQHSEKEDEIFQCDICNKILKNSVYFRTHLKTHEEKLFKCQFCDRKFVDQGQLNYHMKFHENPEQFKCKICGHQSTRKGSLEKHLKIHIKNNFS